MIWWLIPLVATLAAWVYLRIAGAGRAAHRRRPEPGSPEDRADLARFAAALESPMPGRAHAPTGPRTDARTASGIVPHSGSRTGERA